MYLEIRGKEISLNQERNVRDILLAKERSQLRSDRGTVQKIVTGEVVVEA